MKKLYYFKLSNDPFCKQTQIRLLSILAHNSKYRKIPIEIVDILEKPFLVKQFEIEKYPAFYIGKTRVYEGELEEKEITQILEMFLNKKWR